MLILALGHTSDFLFPPASPTHLLSSHLGHHLSRYLDLRPSVGGLLPRCQLGFDEASLEWPGRVNKRKGLLLFTGAASAAFNLPTLELKTKNNTSL